LQILGEEYTNYKSHSFRIGAAIKGVAVDEIKTAGRWKSDAFKSYIRA